MGTQSQFKGVLREASRASLTLKRLLDLVFAIVAIAVLSLPMMGIALIVRMTSAGPALYWSERVGRNNRLFRMPKFRTMQVNAPEVATHLLENPEMHITRIGAFLRRTSLDELPQLWSILVGDMSFVGPRPALHNQADLIALRTDRGLHRLMPGLTGWAQIHGRDELPIPVKVELDAVHLERSSFRFDLYVLALTAWKVLRGDDIAF